MESLVGALGHELLMLFVCVFVFSMCLPSLIKYLKRHCATIYQLHDHADGKVSCNKVNGVSVSVTPPSYHLFLHCVTALRGQDHSRGSKYKFSTCNIVISKYVVSTYVTTDNLLQTWDLYLWQWCCNQKLWGAPNHTKCQFLHNVALKEKNIKPGKQPWPLRAWTFLGGKIISLETYWATPKVPSLLNCLNPSHLQIANTLFVMKWGVSWEDNIELKQKEY